MGSIIRIPVFIRIKEPLKSLMDGAVRGIAGIVVYLDRDPLCSRRYADEASPRISPDHDAHRSRSMAVRIVRLQRMFSVRIVPTVHSAAPFTLQVRMVEVHAVIHVGDNDPQPSVSHIPELGCMDSADIPFGRCGIMV